MKIIYALDLLAYFLWQLLVSNVRVFICILSGRPKLKPSVQALPLTMRSPYGITLLAHLITLTPGTLSIDVSDDRKFLVVHSLFESEDGFQQRVKRLFS